MAYKKSHGGKSQHHKGHMADHHSGHHSETRGSAHVDPDHGNPMQEGEMSFNKGYHEDHGNDSPYFPEHKMRGNRYAQMQNEIARRDEAKIARSKFSKIA